MVVLFGNLAVVLWGAVVRATGSGAGCGSHWPLCDDVLVRSPRVETLIEFSHRLSSGLALILVLAMTILAWRTQPASSSAARPVRVTATLAAFFILSEALIGAVLVLWRLVANDASAGRALSVSLHLTNTFFLLASIALTAYFARGGAPVRLRGQGPVPWIIAVPVTGTLLVGTSGAIAALGDTLFPARSLADGLAADLSSTAHVFVRLRALHPVLALLTAAAAMVTVTVVRSLRPSARVRRLGTLVIAGYSAQVGLGLVNIVLMAPIALQLTHLLVGDGVWLLLVLFAAAALEDRHPSTGRSSHGEDRAPERVAPA